MTVQHIVLFSFPRELSAQEAADMRAMVASWPGEIGPVYLADVYVATERARSLVRAALAGDPLGRPEGVLAREAAMAKAAASEAGREVTAAAIQMHGGIGFTWEADVHWLYKRAQLDAAMLGGSRRHREALARSAASRVAASAR